MPQAGPVSLLTLALVLDHGPSRILYKFNSILKQKLTRKCFAEYNKWYCMLIAA